MNLVRTIVMTFICASVALAQQATLNKCSDDPVYQLLDFWLGEWEVFSGEQKLGENKIDKILDGCAVLENWTATGGGLGMSLFYVDADGLWQQVWVTEWSANPGGMKEKTFVAETAKDGVRFQGELKHPKIGSYLDRTTLTPLDDGAVRQLIEISRDGGETWEATFDAVYRPAMNNPDQGQSQPKTPAVSSP